MKDLPLVWRWAGVLLGVLVLAMGIANIIYFRFSGPGISPGMITAFLPCVGISLIRACFLPTMGIALIRIVMGIAALFLISPLTSGQGAITATLRQFLGLLFLALTTAALGAWVPLRARRLAYGIVLAFAWVVAVSAFFDAWHIGEFFDILFSSLLLLLNVGLTLVYRAWDRTGLPPQSVLSLSGISANEPHLYLEGRPGDAEPEVRTISR